MSVSITYGVAAIAREEAARLAAAARLEADQLERQIRRTLAIQRSIFCALVFVAARAAFQHLPVLVGINLLSIIVLAVSMATRLETEMPYIARFFRRQERAYEYVALEFAEAERA